MSAKKQRKQRIAVLKPQMGTDAEETNLFRQN
jgi:hypothetical protein